jgi:hypothetical protein
VETFTEPKKLVKNPHYPEQRKKSISKLNEAVIDGPIVEIINRFNRIPCCFTMQSCYGHFLHSGQKDPHNLEALPVSDTISEVEYRIAYIAFCIENSNSGRRLLGSLKRITMLDPENIQFCCAEWFWKHQVNSYALQVEPDRFKNEDSAILGYKEALSIEKTRNEFFSQLKAMNHGLAQEL